MADNDVTRIAGNIGAMSALNALTVINKNLNIYQTRLASGKRINSAADDPAGLTIATKLNARSEGLKTALSNIGDAKNLLAVAESGLGRINDILIQMRNKSESGASDTMGTNERQALIDQMTAYATQIDDIVDQTKWTSSGGKLIGGDYLSTSHGLTFQTGVDAGENTTLSGLADMHASNGTDSLDIAHLAAASYSIGNMSALFSAATAAAPTNTLLTPLSTGTYQVAVNYGTDGTAATVQLFANGSTSPLLIDADGTVAGGSVNNTITRDLHAAPGVIDFGNGLSVTVAAGTTGTATGTVDFNKSGGTYALKINNTTDLTASSSAADFSAYMSTINSKLDIVSGQLAKIGALTGRLTFKEDQISTAQINVEGAYNRIMNANMAEEQVNASKYQILQQTATAMLSQANTAPQFLLSLFK
jgi:flagellin